MLMAMKTALFLFSLILSCSALAECPSWSARQAEEQLQKLNQEVQYHNHLYFQKNAPVLSDHEFDALAARLKALSDCFPEIRLDPDKKLTIPASSSQKIRHQAFMGSLRKADNKIDIVEFLQNAHDSTMILQPKIDGVAVELVYEHGKLVAASTRGDGNKGRDILAKIKAVPGIPKKVFSDFARIVLHGELFARLDIWQEHSRQDKSVNGRYSSARHFVAGIVQSNQLRLSDLQMLDFFPWQWVDNPFETQSITHHQLYGLGFDLPTRYSYSVRRLDDVVKLRNQLEQDAINMPFIMDGIVLKIDSVSRAEELGWSGNTPDYALAWKFPPSVAVSTVTKIEFRVGRTGNITPVVHFKPVRIKGEIISRVSLGSSNNLRKKDIAIGDEISVVLKGAATPVFSQVVLRAVDRAKPLYPNPDQYNGFTCLSMSKGCEEQFIARLKWMAKRLGFPGLDEDILQALVRQKVIHELADLFKVSREQLIRAGVSNVQPGHIRAAIERVQDVPFEQQVRALSIPGIGKAKSRMFASQFKDWKLLFSQKNNETLSQEVQEFISMEEIEKVLKLFIE